MWRSRVFSCDRNRLRSLFGVKKPPLFQDPSDHIETTRMITYLVVVEPCQPLLALYFSLWVTVIPLQRFSRLFDGGIQRRNISLKLDEQNLENKKTATTGGVSLRNPIPPRLHPLGGFSCVMCLSSGSWYLPMVCKLFDHGNARTC